MSRDVLKCIEPTKCAECDFTILVDQDMVLGDWGWTHLLCAEEKD
jgi:hypothetical protein